MSGALQPLFASPKKTIDLFVSNKDAVPYLTAWKVNSGSGIGTKYTDLSGANAPSNAVATIAVSKDNTLVLTDDATDKWTAYVWELGVGWGVKYATNGGSQPVFVDIAPDKSYVVGCDGGGGGGNINLYKWSNGFGTRYIENGPGSAGNMTSVAVSPNSKLTAVAATSTPYVAVYQTSQNGIGFKYANPSTLPAGSAYIANFSPDGKYIAVGTGSDPRIAVYQWNDETGFGVQITPTDQVLNGQIKSIKFFQNNKYLVCANSNHSLTVVYEWNAGTFGLQYQIPDGANTGYSGDISPNGGEYAAPKDANSLQTNPFSPLGWGTKYTDTNSYGTKVLSARFTN